MYISFTFSQQSRLGLWIFSFSTSLTVPGLRKPIALVADDHSDALHRVITRNYQFKRCLWIHRVGTGQRTRCLQWESVRGTLGTRSTRTFESNGGTNCLRGIFGFTSHVGIVV